MKCRGYRCRPGTLERVSRSVEDAGARWLRFGNELFVVTPNKRWPGVEQRAREHGGEAGTDVRAPRKQDLFLVVQKGRTFQSEYPDVPVVFDKGRFLIVEIDPGRVAKIARHEEPCFRIRSLPKNRVVFDERLEPESRRNRDANVGAIVDSLDSVSLHTALTQLVSYPTRLSTSTHYAQALDWSAERFVALGYQVRRAPITVGATGSSANVIARKVGTGTAPRRHVLVTAHLDSVNQTGGPSAPAPGADDNASGSAGVLEIARVLGGLDFRNDLSLVLFGGEEQGLHGSRQYVAGLGADERSAILGVMNMDMIGGLNTVERTVLLEGAATSQTTIDGLADAAMTYTDLIVQTSLDPFASDHVPFLDAGLPAVLTIEGADGANDAIHTANDTLDRVDIGLSLEILKMNTAAVVELAGLQQQLQPTPSPGPVKGGAPRQDDNELVRTLSMHYQHLLAQYSRLHRDGRLLPQDYQAWQSLRRLHDTTVGAVLNDQRGGSCGC